MASDGALAENTTSQSIHLDSYRFVKVSMPKRRLTNRFPLGMLPLGCLEKLTGSPLAESEASLSSSVVRGDD